jgi:hypothetical protein
MSSLIRIMTAAAIASAAVLTATGAVGAAPVPARLSRTSLSAQGSLPWIQHARRVYISGVLTEGTAGLAGEVVYLDASVGGGRFSVLRQSTTSHAGGIQFAVWPTGTTRYELVFTGTSKLAASRSPIVMIRML